MKNGQTVAAFEPEIPVEKSIRECYISPMKTCTKCGEEKSLADFYPSKLGRLGKHSQCKDCGRVRARQEMAKLRADKPERDKAACAKYYRTHTEEHRARGRKWAEKHRERRRPLNARRQARRRAENGGHERAVAAEWRRNNPDKQMAYREARRARTANAPGGGVSGEDWREVRESSLGLCAYCNEPRHLTMDHIDALVSGGSHDPSNVIAACRPCNQSKGRKSLLHWLARRAMERAA